MASAAVVLDVGRGEARLGETVVEIRSAGHGWLRVAGPTGPVLRPVTWQERMHAVARSLGSAGPRECLAGELRAAATTQDGEADPVVCEIIALRLAGAGEPAPPFAEAALRVVQATGWDPAQLASSEAAEVDRLAVALVPEAEDAGWEVFLLAATELPDLRAELADDLLARGERRPGAYAYAVASAPTGAPRRTEAAPPSAEWGAPPPTHFADVGATVGPTAARPSPVERFLAEPADAQEPAVAAAVLRRSERLEREADTLVALVDPSGTDPPGARRGALVAPSNAVLPGTAPASRLPVDPRDRVSLGARRAVGGGARELAPLGRELGAAASSDDPGPLDALGWRLGVAQIAATRARSAPSPDVGGELHRRGRAVVVSASSAVELGDALAELLDDEADLRGLSR